MPGVLQVMLVEFHGSSYRLQHLLQDLASTAALASLQQTILGLALGSVTFSPATAKQNRRSIFNEMLVKRSFPALHQRQLVKTVFPKGELLHHYCG